MPTGDRSPAQIETFDDTRYRADTAETAFQQVRIPGNAVADMLTPRAPSWARTT